MAEPATKPKGGLGKKIGPLPAWGWGLIVFAVLAWFLFFRKSNKGTTAGVVQSGQSSYVDPVSQNAGDVNAAQAGQPSTVSAPADSLSPQVLDALNALPSQVSTAVQDAFASSYAMGASPYATATGYGAVAPLNTGPTQGTATVSAPTATKPQAKAKAGAKTSQPFGGIVHKKKLKNGATLTTYASGRQVEQLPGKRAFVVRKGR